MNVRSAALASQPTGSRGGSWAPCVDGRSLPAPGPPVSLDGEGLDAVAVRADRIAVVVGEGGEDGVQLLDPGQPLVVGDLAAADRSEPVSSGAADGQREPAAGH